MTGVQTCALPILDDVLVFSAGIGPCTHVIRVLSLNALSLLLMHDGGDELTGCRARWILRDRELSGR